MVGFEVGLRLQRAVSWHLARAFRSVAKAIQTS